MLTLSKGELTVKSQNIEKVGILFNYETKGMTI